MVSSSTLRQFCNTDESLLRSCWASAKFSHRSSTSSRVACEKFSRITVIPALTTLNSGSRCSDVGPIVATILVSGSFRTDAVADEESDGDADTAVTKSKLVVPAAVLNGAY